MVIDFTLLKFCCKCRCWVSTQTHDSGSDLFQLFDGRQCKVASPTKHHLAPLIAFSTASMAQVELRSSQFGVQGQGVCQAQIGDVLRWLQDVGITANSGLGGGADICIVGCIDNYLNEVFQRATTSSSNCAHHQSNGDVLISITTLRQSSHTCTQPFAQILAL